MNRGRYWIVLFNEGCEWAGIQRELARCDRLDPPSAMEVPATGCTISEAASHAL